MIVKADQGVRIHRLELREVLGSQFDFLWAFAQKRCRCRHCQEGPHRDRPYRIFVNGLGDFTLYNYCRECDYPIQFYVDMSEEPGVSIRIQDLWLSYHN